MHPHHAEKFVVVGARSAYTWHTGANGTRWRVRRSHSTHVRGASCTKCSWHAHRPFGEMDAIGVLDHPHADSANDCAPHRELIAAVRGSQSTERGPRRVGPAIGIDRGPECEASGGPLSPDGGRRACRQQRRQRLASDQMTENSDSVDPWP